MKTDIKNRNDIIKLVDAFYKKVKTDAVIGYFFTDVARVNWEVHLAKMYDFWENIMFYSGDYNGNPMVAHKELHKKSPMNTKHFQHWNKLFTDTVDELFAGEKADLIKERAFNISVAMMHKSLEA
ncbi:group III truncated hemoglobin [Flavobacterium sp. H122]|uniref:group III truncated hemoglobin n=1 Tax=Flavobacterium sp. H122 TaxID=2529860 RepID=UPI0010AA9B1D|nr:group III truncated hemoglobin [Flavobacterium sp. H122]